MYIPVGKIHSYKYKVGKIHSYRLLFRRFWLLGYPAQSSFMFI